MGWEGIVDGDDEAVSFNNGTKAQLLDVPMMAGALIEAFFESLVEAKRKN